MPNKIVALESSKNRSADPVQCPCPNENECFSEIKCIYGIDDEGNLYYNDKKDTMNLTKIAQQKYQEIKNDDDVMVNLYNPYLVSFFKLIYRFCNIILISCSCLCL